MKWVAISGSWRYLSDEVEKDVRNTTREIFINRNGIIAGGAPGVDYWATDEALNHNPDASRIKVFLPTSLIFYINHLKKRTNEGIISDERSKNLIDQLNRINMISPFSIVEGRDIPGNIYVEEWQYFNRNGLIIEAADELFAFHVNDSPGVADSIKKARVKGIPIKIYKYKVM